MEATRLMEATVGPRQQNENLAHFRDVLEIFRLATP